MKVLKYFIFCLGLSLAQERSKYANKTADISSINNLAYKSPITLDPKIRRALLNVLNRLEEQDNKRTSATKKGKNDYYEYFSSSPPSTVTQPPPRTADIKWEYKTDDTGAFKEFDYFNFNAASTSRSVSNELKDGKNVNGDGENERGALFFQIPAKQAKHVSDILSGLNVSPSSSPKNVLPGSDILFANLQNEINKQNQIESISTTPVPSPSISDDNGTEEATESRAIERNVEFFKAPLLTAFTLEQDERGLPRRIIPLEVPEAELQSLLRNRINHDVWEGRRIRDQEKDTAVAGAASSSFIRKPDLQAQENVAPLDPFLLRSELESQYQQLQERKRQIELEKERLLAEQEKARRLNFVLERQQKEQEYARALNRNEIFNSEVAFQKSVEPQVRMLVPLPTVVSTPPFSPFNLAAFPWQQPVQHFRAAASPAPATQQFANFPRIVDRQLQSLFQQSGLNPQGQQEDLNIVSKVLALNHESSETSRSTPKRGEIARDETSMTDARTENTTASVTAKTTAGAIPSRVNFEFGRPDFIF